MRPDGSLDHACHRGIPSVIDLLVYKARLDRLAPRSRRLGHYRLSWLNPATVHDVEACSGAFLLMRREVLDAVGGWDERYWFYAEDLDLCLRVAQAGWRVQYVGSATAVHVKGGSSNLRRSTQNSPTSNGRRDGGYGRLSSNCTSVSTTSTWRRTRRVHCARS